MIKPKLHRISLVSLPIGAIESSPVVYSSDIQALRDALHDAICSTFTTWQGPSITKPLGGSTRKMCKIWRRSNGGITKMRVF